jgi:hypothetical protein
MQDAGGLIGLIALIALIDAPICRIQYGPFGASQYSLAL